MAGVFMGVNEEVNLLFQMAQQLPPAPTVSQQMQKYMDELSRRIARGTTGKRRRPSGAA